MISSYLDNNPGNFDDEAELRSAKDSCASIASPSSNQDPVHVPSWEIVLIAVFGVAAVALAIFFYRRRRRTDIQTYQSIPNDSQQETHLLTLTVTIEN